MTAQRTLRGDVTPHSLWLDPSARAERRDRLDLHQHPPIPEGTGLTVTGTEVTITDDETASTSVALTVDPATVGEDAAATTVTATLNEAARAEAIEVTVSVGSGTATSGTDFAAVSDLTVTIAAGAYTRRSPARLTIGPKNLTC